MEQHLSGCHDGGQQVPTKGLMHRIFLCRPAATLCGILTSPNGADRLPRGRPEQVVEAGRRGQILKTHARRSHENCLGKNNLPPVGGVDDLDAVPGCTGCNDRYRSVRNVVLLGRRRRVVELTHPQGRREPAASPRPRPGERKGPSRRDDRQRGAVPRRKNQQHAGRRGLQRRRAADHRHRRHLVGLETLALRGRKARNARFAAGVFVWVCAALLSGCASLWPQTAQLREGLPPGLPERVELTQVPFFPQSEYQCGPAALAIVLASFGAKVTREALVQEVYLPERKGSLKIEILAAARRHGMVSYQLAPRFEDVLRELSAGNPVIVLQTLGFGGGWHYAVAVGYDYSYGELILRSGIPERETLPFGIHEFLWKRSGYWAMVAVPPDRIPVTADESRWLASIAALERAGTASSARTAYAGFLKRWPGNINAAVGLANAHHALGELPQAEAGLRQAERRDPAYAHGGRTAARSRPGAPSGPGSPARPRGPPTVALGARSAARGRRQPSLSPAAPFPKAGCPSAPAAIATSEKTTCASAATSS